MAVCLSVLSVCLRACEQVSLQGRGVGGCECAGGRRGRCTCVKEGACVGLWGCEAFAPPGHGRARCALARGRAWGTPARIRECRSCRACVLGGGGAVRAPRAAGRCGHGKKREVAVGACGPGTHTHTHDPVLRVRAGQGVAGRTGELSGREGGETVNFGGAGGIAAAPTAPGSWPQGGREPLPPGRSEGRSQRQQPASRPLPVGQGNRFIAAGLGSFAKAPRVPFLPGGRPPEAAGLCSAPGLSVRAERGRGKRGRRQPRVKEGGAGQPHSCPVGKEVSCARRQRE